MVFVRTTSRKRPASGFTMIELIVVIVILGIIAAMAVPRMVSVTSEATEASLNGLASAAASAMQLNQTGCVVSAQVTSGVHAAKCRQVRYCDDVVALLVHPVDATVFSISHADLGTVNNATGQCVVTHLGSGAQQSFTGIAAGNP